MLVAARSSVILLVTWVGLAIVRGHDGREQVC
jgi:hypothetical protein